MSGTHNDGRGRSRGQSGPRQTLEQSGGSSQGTRNLWKAVWSILITVPASFLYAYPSACRFPKLPRISSISKCGARNQAHPSFSLVRSSGRMPSSGLGLQPHTWRNSIGEFGASRLEGFAHSRKTVSDWRPQTFLEISYGREADASGTGKVRLDSSRVSHERRGIGRA